MQSLAPPPSVPPEAAIGRYHFSTCPTCPHRYRLQQSRAAAAAAVQERLEEGERVSAMAESQLVCLDDDHVNEKIPESKPEFYYSEEQRAALEQLLRSGDGAFKMRLKEDNIKDFLSAREVKSIRKTFKEYAGDAGGADSDSETGEQEKPKRRESPSADSGVHSTYWPKMSDTAVPSLDLGWSGSSGMYRGVTRVSVYSHPPKETGPHIKEVVRKLIQESHKVNTASGLVVTHWLYHQLL